MKGTKEHLAELQPHVEMGMEVSHGAKGIEVELKFDVNMQTGNGRWVAQAVRSSLAFNMGRPYFEVVLQEVWRLAGR